MSVPQLCGCHVLDYRFALWWDSQWDLRGERIRLRAILSLLCSMGAGLWVLDTGLGWAKYLSILGPDSRLAWVLGQAGLDTRLSSGSLGHSPVSILET